VLSNIRKGISDVGVDVLDVIPNIIASPEAILGSRQKELGVVAVDIGHSATNMSVYEN
jgi:cell division ATPase FtsA